MSVFYTEDQTVTLIARLTRTRLTAFVEAEAVMPVQRTEGPAYTQGDLARLELLCDLAETYDMNEDAVAVTAAALDQFHAARRRLHLLLGAIAQETPEVRARIAAALIAQDNGG